MTSTPSTDVIVEDIPNDMSSLEYCHSENVDHNHNQPVLQHNQFLPCATTNGVLQSLEPSINGVSSECHAGASTSRELTVLQQQSQRVMKLENCTHGIITEHLHQYFHGNSSSKLALSNVQQNERHTEREVFVKIEKFKEAVAILKESEFLFIIGPPGSGKTTMVRGLLRHFEEHRKSLTPIIIKHASEIPDHLGEDNQILLFDDVFGKDFADRSNFWEWSKYFPTIETARTGNRYIFTSRTSLYRQFMGKVRKNALFRESNQCDLSELSASDKKKLLKKHAEVAVKKERIPKDHCLQGPELERLAKLKTPHGFPDCVRLFISLYHQVSDPEDFFRRPLQFLKEDLKDLWEEDRAAFGALLLAVQCRGYLDQRLLDEYSVSKSQELVRSLLRSVGIPDTTSLFDVTQASDRMRGTYMQQISPQVKGKLELSHPAVYEAVLFVYGDQKSWNIPHFASLDFLISRVTLCTLPSSEESNECEKIILEEGYFGDLANRFYLEILNRRFSMVATHCAFGCEKFIQKFQEICYSQGELGLLSVLIARDGKFGEPLLYWSTWNKSGALFKWVVQELRKLKNSASEECSKMADSLLKTTRLRTATIACCINGNQEALEFIFSSSTKFRQQVIHGLGNRVGHLPVPSFEDFAYKLPLDDREESADIPHRQSLLHIAVLHGNLNIICYLLDECFADVNGGMRIRRDGAPHQDQSSADGGTKIGRTPLHVAARYGYRDIVEKLVEKRADLTVPSETMQKTPLHEACGAGHLEVVEALLQALKDKGLLEMALQMRAYRGLCPLHSAVYSRNSQVVHAILENGGDVEVKDDHDNRPIHLACERPGNDGVLKVLLESGADPCVRNKDMNFPMHIVCWNARDEKMLKTLIQTRKAEVHEFNRRRETPLHMACERKACSLIPILLEHGADISAKNNRGQLPIEVTEDEQIRGILEEWRKQHLTEEASGDSGDEN